MQENKNTLKIVFFLSLMCIKVNVKVHSIRVKWTKLQQAIIKVRAATCCISASEAVNITVLKVKLHSDNNNKNNNTCIIQIIMIIIKPALIPTQGEGTDDDG